MAPTSKTEARRKSSSSGKSSLLVTLNVPAQKLRDLVDPEPVKEESPIKDIQETKESPDDSIALAAPGSSINGDATSESNDATPNAEGTPTPGAMGPPADGTKKKGVKRSAPTANGSNDGIPKPRGKPGPKKKPRLEDGTIDHTNAKAGAGHKLGPKANQGAINAGLRALDRSGKPCRKWDRGGFKLKSFTGVCWEIPRWKAPEKKSLDADADAEESAAASVDSSSKENKENGVENSASNSNNGGDIEMQSVASAAASSPAPMAVAAAS